MLLKHSHLIFQWYVSVILLQLDNIQVGEDGTPQYNTYYVVDGEVKLAYSLEPTTVEEQVGCYLTRPFFLRGYYWTNFPALQTTFVLLEPKLAAIGWDITIGS